MRVYLKSGDICHKLSHDKDQIVTFTEKQDQLCLVPGGAVGGLLHPRRGAGGRLLHVLRALRPGGGAGDGPGREGVHVGAGRVDAQQGQGRRRGSDASG